MNNKGVGVIFFLISAILISTRYLSAAIYMNSHNTWSNELFNRSLEFVGTTLQTWSTIALIAGILFLCLGIYQDMTKSK